MLILLGVCAVIEAAGRSGAAYAPYFVFAAFAVIAGLLDANAARRGPLAGPDGRLPMLGDGWEAPVALSDTRSREPVTVLAQSGHVVLRHGGDQAIFDCGPLCPDHLPAHAHGDALSFVLWADGQPVIVDPGTFAYTGTERARFRATAAHSTVELEGQDQCVFWADFRASFLPRVERPRVSRRDACVVVESSHDGYRRLADPVIHHRALVWVPRAGAVVVDRLQSRHAHHVTSRLQLAPKLAPDGGRAGPLLLAPLGATAVVEQARYAPYLGTCQPSTALVARLVATPGNAFGWSLLRPGASAQVSSEGTLELRLGPQAAPTPIKLKPLD